MSVSVSTMIVLAWWLGWISPTAAMVLLAAVAVAAGVWSVLILLAIDR